ncbi:sulfotransferase family protein [Paracoccus aerodenitrificans]|uniref:sulfotransferase family protein n=1 Tax=Paracoccus aerodenitrificans TaxID=3017781 RepID=UPI0022F0FD04|nr:sulfotransferase [Paracoccus aerodenitrificans]WBU63759.1 sulfotransferase [Paracoccus aerodenitrificans]
MSRSWDAEGKPRKPRILCIGAQKAGTSWLHQQLNEHPKIWTAPIKELHYFNARHRPEDLKWLPWHFRRSVTATEKRFERRQEEMPAEIVRYLLDLTSEPMFTPRWYRQAFAPAPRGMWPLDTTPEYSTLPEKGLDEVANFLPRAKFIYLVRDPVERAISQLRMNLSRKRSMPRNPRGFMKYLDLPELHDRGDYATYIPRWQKRFGPDRLLILPYGRIATEPEKLMRDIEDFLGLVPHDYQNLSDRVHEGAKGVSFPQEGYDFLKKRFAAQYEFLEDRFGADFVAATTSPAGTTAPPVSVPAPAVQNIPKNEDTTHWAESPSPQKPTVIGIGAQKAGTSWLHAAMGQHPGLWTPPLKEAHFFNHLFCPDNRKWTPNHVSGTVAAIRSRYSRSGKVMPAHLAAYLDWLATEPPFTENWYMSLFAPTPPDARPMEITPAYSGLPGKGIDYMLEFLPDARFIYLIRDPVDRAVSQLRMNMRRRAQTPKQASAWLSAAANDAVLEQRGDYARYIPRWRRRLGPDRLLILPYGLIGSAPDALMRQIEDFLDLPRHDYQNLEKRVFATPESDNMPEEVRDILARRLRPQYEFLNTHFDADFNAALC